MHVSFSDGRLRPNLQRSVRSFESNCCFIQRKPPGCLRSQLSKRVVGLRGMFDSRHSDNNVWLDPRVAYAMVKCMFLVTDLT